MPSSAMGSQPRPERRGGRYTVFADIPLDRLEGREARVFGSQEEYDRAMESEMPKSDVLITAGMLADKLRPWATGSATEADAEAGQIWPVEINQDLGEGEHSITELLGRDALPMLALHPATIGAIYQHLERLAKLDGEKTEGQRVWSAWDQAIPDAKWHPHERLDGRWQAIRVTDDGERKVMEFDHEIEKQQMGGFGEHPFEVVVSFMLECDCQARCDTLNAEMAQARG